MILTELVALRDSYADKFDRISRQKEDLIFRLHQIKGKVELLNDLISKEEQEVQNGIGATESVTETAEPSQS